MGNLEAQARIMKESQERMKTLNFGEPVTNICAGNGNPMRHCLFVKYVVKSYTNKWGIIHKDYWAKCTDGKGKFWNINIDVIHAGTLNAEECKKLFDPVWQANFGEKKNEPI